MTMTQISAKQFGGRYFAHSTLWQGVELGLIPVGTRGLIAALRFFEEADIEWTSGFGAVNESGLLTLHMESERGYKFELQHFASGPELWHGQPVSRLVLGRIGAPLELPRNSKLDAQELTAFLCESIFHFERLDDDGESVFPPPDSVMEEAYEG